MLSSSIHPDAISIGHCLSPIVIVYCLPFSLSEMKAVLCVLICLAVLGNCDKQFVSSVFGDHMYVDIQIPDSNVDWHLVVVMISVE